MSSNVRNGNAARIFVINTQLTSYLYQFISRHIVKDRMIFFFLIHIFTIQTKINICTLNGLDWNQNIKLDA